VRRVIVIFGLLQLAGVNVLNGGEPERSAVSQSFFTQTEVLEQIQSKASSLKSLTGRFQQIKSTRLLITPLESRGTFYWQPPDRFRWDVLLPDPFRLVARGDTILLLFPDLNRATLARHPMGTGLLGQITGTAGDAEAFERSYYTRVIPSKESDDPRGVKLSLVPKGGKQARYVKRIDVLIDPGTWLPREVTISEANDDKTTIRLSDVVENLPLQESLFCVEPPEGVQLQQLQGGRRP
jgi:outer membrane lipoprotein-sorting protein